MLKEKKQFLFYDYILMPHTKKPERKFARYALTQQFALRCKDVKSLEQIPGAVLAINTMQKQVILMIQKEMKVICHFLFSP